MSRVAACVAAACVCLGTALAPAMAQDRPTTGGTTGGTTGATTGSAPAGRPGNKLSFPPSLGGASLVHTDTGPTEASYVYALPNRLQITVVVKDVGRWMPTGSENPQVINQFSTELGAAEQQIKANGFTKVERPPVPSACAYGGTTFRCIVLNATGGTTRIFSKMLMTGYNGALVVIRADWAQANQTTVTDADAALQAFVPALLR